jgi:hypothetical protein
MLPRDWTVLKTELKSEVNCCSQKGWAALQAKLSQSRGGAKFQNATCGKERDREAR